MKHQNDLSRIVLPANKLHSFIPKSVFDRWQPSIRAAAGEDDAENTISILDPIGYDPWTGSGVTPNRISAALRSIGAKNPVTVMINSPGGDMFDGLAIYNMLMGHKGEVTVKVLGLAASAASFIAMAGDKIQIAKSAFMMIHNAWVVAMGDRNDLREYADTLEPFDEAIAGIYADRSGMELKKVSALMDKESWLGGTAAVENGLADSVLSYDVETEDDSTSNARRTANRLDAALAQAGLSRSERRDLLREYVSTTRDAGANNLISTRDAADDDMRDAVDSILSVCVNVPSLT